MLLILPHTVVCYNTVSQISSTRNFLSGSTNGIAKNIVVLFPVTSVELATYPRKRLKNNVHEAKRPRHKFLLTGLRLGLGVVVSGSYPISVNRFLEVNMWQYTLCHVTASQVFVPYGSARHK